MTTIRVPASSDPVRVSPNHLSSPFDILNNKTDAKAQKALFQDDLFHLSPVKKTKLEFEGDFPVSPLSLALSSSNARIAKIAFPASPPRSPSKAPYETGPIPYSSPASTPPKLKLSLFDSISAFREKRKLEIPLPSLPLPNLPLPSFPTEVQTTKTQAPPPTPRKKQRTADPVSVFKKQHEALTNNTFKYDVTYLDKGTFSKVYTLETTPVQVIPGVDNSSLVLKAFHGEKKSGFGERALRGYLHNEIENYRAVVAAKLPVARIYNIDTAEQDGYIIQQKVSGKIDLMNAQQMLQVRRFFEISVGQGLIMDLIPQNFALENGQVVLIDFVEDPDDGLFVENPDNGIDLFNKKAIETWFDYYQKAGGTEAQAAAFLNELSANYYQGYVQVLLSRSV
jgi:hypothetical protein